MAPPGGATSKRLDFLSLTGGATWRCHVFCPHLYISQVQYGIHSQRNPWNETWWNDLCKERFPSRTLLEGVVDVQQCEVVAIDMGETHPRLVGLLSHLARTDKTLRNCWVNKTKRNGKRAGESGSVMRVAMHNTGYTGICKNLTVVRTMSCLCIARQTIPFTRKKIPKKSRHINTKNQNGTSNLRNPSINQSSEQALHEIKQASNQSINQTPHRINRSVDRINQSMTHWKH